MKRIYVWNLVEGYTVNKESEKVVDHILLAMAEIEGYIEKDVTMRRLTYTTPLTTQEG